MRNIFLIDFENVGSDGLSGILNLNAEDRVIIFYSTNSNRLTMRAHILIGRAQAQFTYYEASVGGKNALDHQLSTYLGYLIGTSAADRYYIVSRDNGYRYASNFWNGMLKQTVVFCIDTIKNAQKITEKVLGKMQPQEEPTLRTAEDLRNDDLEEGTGEPMDEAETLPETAEAPASASESAPAEEASAPVPQTALTAEAAPAAPEPEAEKPVLSDASPVEAALAADTAAQPEVASTPETAPDEAADFKAEAVPQALPPLPETPSPDAPVSEAPESEPPAADAAAAEAPNSETPAQPEQVSAATLALTVPAILFPEQEIDDVPEPHEQQNGRGRTNNNRRGRKPNGAGQQNRYNRNTRSRQNQNQAQKQNPAHSEEPRPQEHPAEKAQGEKSAQPHGGNHQKSENKPERKAEPRQDTKPEAKPEGKPAADWLTAMLAPYPKLSEEKIWEMITGHKKQILCNSLRKQLGQERGLALYSEIKKAAWK